MTMATKTKAQPAAPEALILYIAIRHFFIETPETQNSEWLDFHNVAVWAICAALERTVPGIGNIAEEQRPRFPTVMLQIATGLHDISIGYATLSTLTDRISKCGPV